MGITLPNFTDLGFNDPRAAGGVPSYPQESPQAAGEAAFGAGIQKAGSAAETVGAYGQIARTRMDRAMADANWYANAAQIDGDLKAESDINKLPDIQARYRQAATQAAGAIGDPSARQMWLAEQEKHVVAGEKGAQLKALGLWRQNYEGNMLSQADGVVRAGAQQDDPRAFQFSLDRISEMADSATQSGVMTPVQAHAFLKQNERQLITGRAQNLINGGRADEASALIDQNTDNLDPTTAEALRYRANQAKIKGLGKSAADEEWGGGDRGYAGAAGGALTGAPATQGGDIPSLRPVPPEYAPIVEKAAMQYGVPAELLARTIHAESGFNPNSVSPTGARGIAQFITSTADQYGVDRADPTSSIMGAAHYLSDLHQQKGSWQGALQGYLGSDPWQDKSYKGSGAIQLASVLDSGKGAAAGADQTQTTAPNSSSIVAFGDSIAAHLIRKAGAGGQESGQVGVYNSGDTAVSGWSPTQVLQAIAKAPDDSIRGKDVVLSTGASNNPSQLDFVQEQIKAFKDRGAASVTVMGVGTKPSLAGVNDRLAQIASDNGAAFSGPLRNVAGDGIHSSDPKAELAAARGAIPAASSQQGTTQSGAGPAPLPDIDAMLQRVQDRADRGDIPQESANAAMADLRSRYNHLQGAQANDRAAMKRTITNGIAALSDGRDFQYDPTTIQHFFPHEQAAELVQALDDAKQGGQLVAGLRTSSLEQIATQRAQIADGLNDPGAPDYAKRRQMLGLFDKAAADHTKALLGPNADPIGYLSQFDPVLQQKRAAIDPKNPQSFQDFATAALSEQERLGVPSEQQHVLSAGASQQIAMSLAKDPEHAPDAMRQLATQYGPAWPHVYGDLVTLGKMPAGYQVVGQLADYDPANAATLARALGADAKDDKAFKSLVSAKAPGGKSIEDIAKQTIPTDSRVVAYERSLADSGSSPSQIVAIRGAVEHLAAGRAIFLHEAPDEATDKAIDAVVGHYEFMPNGGARVPKDRFSDVSANARATLGTMSLDNTAVPTRYGSAPGEPKPQDYIDMVRAAPTWITGPKADRLLLVDPGGHLVTDKSGQPVAVPFSLGNLNLENFVPQPVPGL